MDLIGLALDLLQIILAGVGFVSLLANSIIIATIAVIGCALVGLCKGRCDKFVKSRKLKASQ